jgi:hypothetical protein
VVDKVPHRENGTGRWKIEKRKDSNCLQSDSSKKIDQKDMRQEIRSAFLVAQI